ncbi:Signal transduction histidine-protein kinase BarA [Pseudobythopirellula maris]|uniref:histidine kinase n=1 Tax=Pseudobythopirellula maris TaxID=2527991 RepID=A0A5C5ZL56_9BACT|nr:ATP-binding protein [Pseudobythopirellula maris]TWT87163.1 Signal transduction histidine-protein kinase BarA [Pseudobythopirellula maris]
MKPPTASPPARHITVGRKISLGFAIVLALHVSIAVLSHQGLTKADGDRARINALREQVTLFYEINRIVGEVRHNVSLFVHNGFAGPERRAMELFDRLETLLAEAEQVNLFNREAASLVAMRSHVETHREILEAVVADRANRDQILHAGLKSQRDELLAGLAALRELRPDDTLTNAVRAELRLAELSVMRFVNDPDSSHVRDAVTHLKEARRRIAAAAAGASGAQARLLDELIRATHGYRERIIQLVQATRGYLHLTNVVLAGEEQEFLYHARKIQTAHAEGARALSESMLSSSVRYQRASNWFSLVTIVLGVLAAWMIKRDIAPTLQSIAATFERLTRGEECGAIPGAERSDELGELAAAAQVFKEKAAETTRLLRESETAKAELNTLNGQLAEQTAIAEQMATEATAATRSKSEFLANMSHEIRTPMTAILGFTTILEECDDPDQHRDAVGTIRRNGEHLLGVINDILDLSKVEAGKLTVSLAPVDPRTLLLEAIGLMQVKADGAGVSLSMTIDSPLPRKIASDAVRLRQVLLNLIGNAIKFTEAGGVSVNAGYDEISEGFGTLRVDIVDSGIGIHEEQQALLFQPFSQADNSMQRDFGGTGLGLAISKRLAEMLGGDVRLVSSSPGEGSHFRLTIDATCVPGSADQGPLAPVAATQNAAVSLESTDANPGSLVKKRVLIAEDGPDNQRFLRFVLERAGAEVRIVENGLIATETLLASDDQEEAYDCVLMDMQMPVCDGYEATRLLREAGYRRPIVALTAHAMDSDRQKCLDAGCDDFQTKPVDPAKLLSVVAAWAQRAESPLHMHA